MIAYERPIFRIKQNWKIQSKKYWETFPNISFSKINIYFKNASLKATNLLVFEVYEYKGTVFRIVGK